MLHITNGDAAAEPIRALGLGGDVIAWKDVLHEGPVPAPATLDSLRPIRARFLAGYDSKGAVEIARELEERDRRLGACERDGEVALWFEHDLYDQLQLAQILDWWASQPGPPERVRVTLAQSNDYLGHMSGERLRALWESRREVTDAQMTAAQRAWGAFAQPDPRAVEQAAANLPELPYLGPALVRHLEEFPAVGTGLARSERHILETLVVGSWPFGDLFRAAHHDREDPYFLGDTTFRDRLMSLATGDDPLVNVEGNGERAWLTDTGRAVLAGERDRVEVLGIDRWLGGVHLKGRTVPFRWDEAARRIVAE
jgi:hypothetical protein